LLVRIVGVSRRIPFSLVPFRRVCYLGERCGIGWNPTDAERRLAQRERGRQRLLGGINEFGKFKTCLELNGRAPLRWSLPVGAIVPPRIRAHTERLGAVWEPAGIWARVVVNVHVCFQGTWPRKFFEANITLMHFFRGPSVDALPAVQHGKG